MRRLRGPGFDGPFSGTRHQFMVSGTHRLTIPSNAEYSVPQLRVLLHEVETIIGRVITAQEWFRTLTARATRDRWPLIAAITFHDLRHDFAHWAPEAGWSLHGCCEQTRTSDGHRC